LGAGAILSLATGGMAARVFSLLSGGAIPVFDASSLAILTPYSLVNEDEEAADLFAAVQDFPRQI